jgi:hypothetical protein
VAKRWYTLAWVLASACQCGGLDLSGDQFTCQSNADCAAGHVCINGVCRATGSTDSGGPIDGGGTVDAGHPDGGRADAGTDAGVSDGGFDAGPVDAGCPAGQTPCPSGCADLTGDVQNCGGCGHACAPAAGGAVICMSSACVSTCPSGETACGSNANGGGVCTSLTTTQNCGACGNACATPSNGTVACTGGGCVSSCATPLTLCGASPPTGGGACVDFASDPNNCGACGSVCAFGLCGTSISASMQVVPADWNFNGTAAYDSNALSGVLTVVNVLWQAGSILYAHPINTDAFDLSFDFRTDTADGGERADGLGFVIELDGGTAFGVAGGGLAMAGLNGYGVELDLYDNMACGDADDNHAAIDLLDACDPVDLLPTPVQVSPTLTDDIGDGTWRTVLVHFAGGAMSVTVNGNMVLSNVALPNFDAGVGYYYGFTGATGGLGARTEVRNVILVFPTPRCL